MVAKAFMQEESVVVLKDIVSGSTGLTEYAAIEKAATLSVVRFCIAKKIKKHKSNKNTAV